MIEIWSDGSSSGHSNKPGGWAYIIIQDNDVICCDYGGDPSTTNNAMEIEGAIRGIRAWSTHLLNAEQSNRNVTLISDSQLTLGFATGQYRASKNVERAQELHELYTKWCSCIRWIPGHSNYPVNERCDRLAKRGKKEIENKLSKMQ